MKPFQIVSLIATLALLSACGFQLRGSADLPPVMQQTYLDISDRTGDFGRSLTRSLEANGIEVVNDPEQASSVLRIPQERFLREAASFSGNALISEFRITFQVSFQLFAANGDALSSRRQVRLFRDYSYDRNEVLASQREEEFLRQNLQRDMVSEVIRRLETIQLNGSGI